MRFQVPKFIEHEPKVVGPLTFRQFIYLAIPGAIAFFLYFLAPFFVFVVATVFLGGLGFLFAFIRLGGRSVPGILSSFFMFTISPKRYIWKKGPSQVQAPEGQYTKQAQVQAAPQEPQKAKVQLVQKSKVRDLATKVETKK